MKKMSLLLMLLPIAHNAFSQAGLPACPASKNTGASSCFGE
jgi:hypothetical protein